MFVNQILLKQDHLWQCFVEILVYTAKMSVYYVDLADIPYKEMRSVIQTQLLLKKISIP